MSLVAIAEYTDRLDADLARLTLAGEGVDSFIFDGGMASLGLGIMTPARIMVLPEEADLARSILSDMKNNMDGA